MHNDRNPRRPQRRGFDDDNFSPPDRFGLASRESGPRFEASPAGPPVQATVKWYNPDKGFGFVGLPGGGDAFLHVSVVERSGNSTMPPGATLEVRVGPGQKGQQVTEILNVDTSTAQQEPARRPRPEPRHAPPGQATVEELGTVKFYAAEKGFGFIVRDLGGKDMPPAEMNARYARKTVGFLISCCTFNPVGVPPMTTKGLLDGASVLDELAPGRALDRGRLLSGALTLDTLRRFANADQIIVDAGAGWELRCPAAQRLAAGSEPRPIAQTRLPV